MRFAMAESPFPVLLAPLLASSKEDVSTRPSFVVDMALVEKCNRELSPSALRRPSDEARRRFEFDAATFEDAVVTPWYRPTELPTHFYVAEILAKKTPVSAFPDDNFKSFNDYFEHKYKIDIFAQTQPMLDADYTTGRLNMLIGASPPSPPPPRE